MFKKKVLDPRDYAPGSRVIPAMNIDVPMPRLNSQASDIEDVAHRGRGNESGILAPRSSIIPELDINVPMPRLGGYARDKDGEMSQVQGESLVRTR
jgi:hypothetical protein